MFTGTIRYNIDPLHLSSDDSILSLLVSAGLSHLKDRSDVPYLKDILSIEISGDNLSSGEKSLICICRAILKRSKIIILDEATANVDNKTEERI